MQDGEAGSGDKDAGCGCLYWQLLPPKGRRLCRVGVVYGKRAHRGLGGRSRTGSVSRKSGAEEPFNQASVEMIGRLTALHLKI